MGREVVEKKLSAHALTHYMDESGHDLFFDEKGRCIVGKNGCSKTFIVAAAEIKDDREFGRQLSELRAQVLADPELCRIPSLDPARGKTALFFHAKDDHPKVRDRVFELLKTFDIRVFAAFRRKSYVAWMIKNRADHGGAHEATRGNMYSNLMMTLMTKRFFWLKGHHRIVVAHRKKAKKWESLQRALIRANVRDKNREAAENRKLTIQPAYPADHPGLQIVDYYLWALQRMLERGEDKYFDLLRAGFIRVYDIDDRTRHPAGERYFDGNPLTLEKLKPVLSG